MSTSWKNIRRRRARAEKASDPDAARQHGQKVLDSFGEKRWGDDLYRGTNVDGPLSHSVQGWAHRLGVTPREVELAMARAMRLRKPLKEPFGNITFACLELLRTAAGCDALYRLIAEEIEFEARVTRVLAGRP